MQPDFIECKASFLTDESGRVTGKAWDFSSPDRVGDVIEPAAFAKAVGKSLPMLFAHDQAQVVGTWDGIAVDADGLSVSGKLLVGDVQRATEVHKLLQAKSVTGLSVGFITKKAAPRKGGGRSISDLDLVEVSLVAVPAHDGARITNVKDMSMTANAAEVTETKNYDADIEAVTKRLDAIEAKANRMAADNDNQDDPDVETKALNQFLRTGQVDAELKTLVVGTPASGGYTVAPEYATNIIKKLVELSPMRRLASVMSIGTSKIYIPTLDTDAAGGWVTETGTRSSSEPTFDQIEIDVFEHAVVIPVSRQLLEDSFIDLSSFLADRIATKFAQAEATAFTKGDGSGKPEGLLAAGNSFDSVTAKLDGSDLLAKIVELYYSLPTPYAQRASWGMTRATMGKIRAAADVAANRSGIWSDGLADGTPARLLGAPVEEFPDMDGWAASKTVAVLGDFSQYQIVDRVGLDIMRDDYTGADTGVVKFRARRRVGGKLLLEEAFKTLATSAT